ncbi:MAG: hypothetical protein KF819_31520 [Labilithrix sp.]|nr:hypothetical protein [Labilithrix sp.]
MERAGHARRSIAGLVTSAFLAALAACNAISGVNDLAVEAACADCDLDGGSDAALADDRSAQAPDAAPTDATSPEGPGGVLDPTFGAGGVASIALLSNANAVAVHADGSIYVAGDFQNGLAAVRLDATGAVDPTFGAGGRLVAGTLARSSALAAIVDAKGRLVMAGSATNALTTPTTFPYMVRVAAGALDATFASGGRWITGNQGGEILRGLTAGPAASVVAVARAGGAVSFWKLDENGNADGAFGVEGRGTVDNVNGNAAAVIAVADGFVAAGDAAALPGRALALLKVGSAGIASPTFGTAGKSTVRLGTVQDEGAACAEGPASALYAAGDFDPRVDGVRRRAAVVKMTATGAPDATFGAEAKVFIDLADTTLARDSFTYARDLHVDAKGRAVFVGEIEDRLIAGNVLRHRAIVARLRADGSFDPLFGAEGKLVFGGAANALVVRRAAFQPDGKLVIVGVTNGPAGQPFVARVIMTTP